MVIGTGKMSDYLCTRYQSHTGVFSLMTVYTREGGNTNKIQADTKHVTTADLVCVIVSVRARNIVAANI